jgi:DNA-directed RNA polymerase specialized sigma24 family protein
VALAALQGLDRLRDPEKLAGWLAGTARYQSLELIRQRRANDPLSPGIAAYDPNPEDSMQRDRDLVTLRTAYWELDERCRRLIARLDLKEPPDSYREVAKAEGLASSSIGPIRRRCLDRLGRVIEKLSHRPSKPHYKGEG